MTLQRWLYYIRSVWTILTRFEQPLTIIKAFWDGAFSTHTLVKLRQHPFQFCVRSPMDVWIIKETCIDQEYFQHVTVEPNWTILDIGGGLGDFAILAASQAVDGCVHCYEPFWDSAELLTQNIARNNIANIVAHTAAVAAKEGWMTLTENDAPAVSKQFTYSQQRQATSVRCVSLSQALALLPNGHCDLLKIDCEGGEFDIILASPSEIFDRIDRICLEYHNDLTPHTHLELVERLQQHGYTILLDPNPVHANLGLISAEK